MLNIGKSQMYLKLVKDAVVFIEAAEFRAKVLVDGESLNRFRLHVQVPDFHWEIVPGNVKRVIYLKTFLIFNEIWPRKYFNETVENSEKEFSNRHFRDLGNFLTWKSCSVPSLRTWHLRWRRWSLRRMICWSDLLAPQTSSSGSRRERTGACHTTGLFPGFDIVIIQYIRFIYEAEEIHNKGISHNWIVPCV